MLNIIDTGESNVNPILPTNDNETIRKLMHRCQVTLSKGSSGGQQMAAHEEMS